MLSRRSPGLLLILLALLFAPLLPCAAVAWEDSSAEMEAVAVARPLLSPRDSGRIVARETPKPFTSSAPHPPLRPSARELTGRLNQ